MRTRVIVLASLGVAAAALGAAFLYRSGALQQIEASGPVPVVAVKVASHDVPIYLRGVGTVVASNHAEVRSRISGRIVKIFFHKGQMVRQGDLLAQIDPSPYQSKLDLANANRDRDRARIVTAQAGLDDWMQLLSKNLATPQVVDAKKAQLAELQAMVKSDDEAVESTERELASTRLNAPIDGVAGTAQIVEGEDIHPGDPNGLVDVSQIEPVSMVFTLPETTLNKIRKQMSTAPVKVLAYDPDDKVKLAEGQLWPIDDQIVATSGMISLRATFLNAKHRLSPGDVVNVRLLLKTQPNGLTVAADAVRQAPSGRYVYVIADDETVERRPVTVAQFNEGEALIATGLTVNERVVRGGHSGLEPGSRVRVLDGSAIEDVNSQNAAR